MCHKFWEPPECSQSSTWRELAAIDSFAPILKGSLVKWFTDSQRAAEHSIRLEVQWIPRTENEKADYISRLIDFDDWQITHDLFLSLEELWGPHTVDCFANYYTAKLPRFFSRFWNPGASGIDFFAQELSSQNSAENCLVAPFSGSSSFSCCSRYPLSEPTESDGYSCSTIMAFVQFLASSDGQISVAH